METVFGKYRRLYRIKVRLIDPESNDSNLEARLLHTPTDQVKVYSTIDDPEAAPLDNLALNYAIYFASMVSVEDSEAQVILKGDKSMLLLQCKSGLEQSFAHGGLLDQPTLAGIHALAIYLVGLLKRYSHLLG